MLYEVETYKSRIIIDNPIHIGCFILQYAELCMLEFYYECLMKYMKPNSFELTETDSIYMAINKDSLDKCIKSEFKSRYDNDIFGSCSDLSDPISFPRRCCSRHHALDDRFCGAMKLEFSGIKMLSLCSKSYIIEDADGKQKISCKGVSKKNLNQPMDKFEHALQNKTTRHSTNFGFRMKGSNIFTYSQEKIGFNYFYCKREVLSDGVSTRPLNIYLSPWNVNVVVVEKDPMSNLYPCKISMNGLNFHSSEQIFYFFVVNHFDQKDLADQIKNSTDPLDVHVIVNDFIMKHSYFSDYEKFMRYSLDQKFNHSEDFRLALTDCRNKQIYYKQPNFKKNEESFWGVTNSSKLLHVIDEVNVAGNNAMGNILMEYASRTV